MKKTKRSKKQEKTGEVKDEGALFGLREKDLDRFVPFIFVALTIFLFRDFIFSDGMIFGTDTIAAGVFFRSFYANVVRTYHALPLWNPFILGGLPFIDAMHGDTFYPTSILKFFMSIYHALGYKLIIHVCLAGITAYHCSRSFRITRFSSLFFGLSYMFSSNLVSLVYGGHDGKMFVITLFPLAMYLLNRGFDSRKVFHFVLFGASVGLMILTAHLQVAYFALWGIGLYFLYRLYGMRGEGRKVMTGLVMKFVLALFIGVTASAVQLIPPYIYLNKFSPRAEGGRGYDFATSWSLHAEEVASLVFTDFSGLDTGSDDKYWGRNFFKINSEYGGILPVLFAILAICLRRKGNVFWLVLSVLALIYGLGANTPIFRIFYTLIPGVKVFRAPSLITFIFTFSVLLMAARGLDSIRNTDKPDQARKITGALFYTLAVLFGLTLFASASPGTFFSLWNKIFYSGITTEKLAILNQSQGSIAGGMWLTILFATAAVGVIWATRKSWSRSFPLIILVLSVITLADLWRVDAKFIQVVNPENYFSRDAAVGFLKQQPGKFRVFPLPGTYPQNHLAFHALEEITGHHGNELRRYREFTGGENLAQLKFINLLNVKYLMTRSEIKHPLFKEVFKADGVIVYENLDMLPRAFIVHRYEVLDGPEEVLERLKADSFDYRNSIVFEENPGVELETTGVGVYNDEWARITEGSINGFDLECNLQEPGFVFLSENFYPSWNAYENGKEISILRCDYTFRAVFLEEGKHTVHFEFESIPLKAGFTITLLSFCGVLVVVAHEFISRRGQRRRDKRR